MYTDASTIALGVILGQIDEKGAEYVCSYASRKLQGAVLNYPIQQLECLAVIYGIKKFREYLYGAPFDVITDHSSLTWLFKCNDPNAS